VVRPRRISDFKPTFTNLAQTSHYQVIFGGLPLGVRQHLSVRGVNYRFITETSGLLCSNAVIPGSTLADAKIIGHFQGVTENMTHSRIFPDITFEFYVDKDYKLLKFFEHYIEFVANGSRYDMSKKDYFFQMEYPDDYKMEKTRLIKFDRDYDAEMEYNFFGMYPFQMANTPVKYENSEVLKISVNFHVDRYAAGSFSSYDVYRGRYNDLKENFLAAKAKQDEITSFNKNNNKSRYTVSKNSSDGIPTDASTASLKNNIISSSDNSESVTKNDDETS